jgi:hypothetical protein
MVDHECGEASMRFPVAQLLVANALSIRAAFASQIYGGLEQHWMWMSTDK